MTEIKENQQGEIYTDLALEERERFQTDVEVEGVKISENYNKELKMLTTVVDIFNDKGAKVMGKPEGSYITMETRFLKDNNEVIKRKLSLQVKLHLEHIIKKRTNTKILIVGLGNAGATPDALGPRVAKKIIIKENIYCIAPGVLAQTGMETYSIIKGIVDEINPDCIIAVDSLAARNLRRVTTTIQIADTGITPGSGIGNHRKGLNNETLGKKVIAIGVPMVVSGATIVNDIMEKLLKILATNEKTDRVSKILGGYSYQEKYQLFEELLSEDTEQVFVTPKDVDEIVENLGDIIADAINHFCQ